MLIADNDEAHGRIKEVRQDPSGTRTTWFLHPDNAGALQFESETAANGSVSQRHYLSAGGRAVGVLVSDQALPVLGSTQTAPPVLGANPPLSLVKLESGSLRR